MTATLVPIQFHGDVVEATLTEDRKAVANLRGMCDNLGIDFASQFTKLKSKPWATIVLVTMVAQDGKQREVTCIDDQTMVMWLATIDAGRVADSARAKLELYQCECAQVLRDHFFGKPAGTGDALLDTIMAIAENRRRQLAMEVEVAKVKCIAENALRMAAAAMDVADSNYGRLAILGYCRVTGRAVSVVEAARWGKLASKLCRERGIPIETSADPRFGRVNTYPTDLLREIFGDEDTTPIIVGHN